MRMTTKRSIGLLAVLTLTAGIIGCATAPATEQARQDLEVLSEATIDTFRQTDPAIERFFNESHGYAVFPNIGKGAVAVGGAYGRGVVYEQGRMIGYADMTQGTIGFQLGGQTYRQVVFFETREAMERFKTGQFALAANASAVLARHGAATAVDYEDGVAVFTLPHGGAMFEAAVGGQRFTFQPL
jgi:lipid-binding SYLF domain-containing protein